MSMAEKVKVEVVDGVEGKSLYINDHRVCGPKPWGGGEAIEHFDVDKEKLEQALKVKDGEDNKNT